MSLVPLPEIVDGVLQRPNSRATTVKPAAGRPQQSRRRIRFIAGAAGTLLFGVGILQLPLAVRSSTEYTAGEPIEVRDQKRRLKTV